MVNFWGMGATKTDGRHFFLIEKFDEDFAAISNSLVSTGFQSSSEAEDHFTYGSGQICFKRLPDNLDLDYFGGFIEPSEKIKQRSLRFLKRLYLIGKFSSFLMVAYGLQWIIAFLAFFANAEWLFDILGFTIPFSFLFFLIAGALFVLIGLYFDTTSTSQNQSTMKHIIDLLISSLRLAISVLTIELIFTKTRVNDRGVMKRLPSEFSEKIKSLGIEEIDAFYWK